MTKRSTPMRPVGEKGDPYPQWVRDLSGKSGVYLIEEAGVLVYIGESHKGSLYETSTRHFQAWSRNKTYWRGAGFSKHDPGLVYERGKCRMAVIITSAQRAIAEQDRQIARLKPRDNIIGTEDEVPF